MKDDTNHIVNINAGLALSASGDTHRVRRMCGNL